MQSIEITGKSVAEATASAATKLGVSPDAVVVTVLEESKGLFGRASVRIRAEAASAVVAVKPSVSKAEAPKEVTEKPKGRAKKVEAAPAEPAVVPEAEPVAEKPKPKGRGKKAEAEPEVEVEAVAGEDDAKHPAATEADAAQLVDMIRGLLAKAELEVNVKSTEIGGRYVTIEIDGKDAAYLVGKQGEVLNAAQYLFNIVGGRRFNNGIRATLDGNDYRRRRETKLSAMASQLAEQVKIRKEEAVLDALPAFERRIVHKVLSEIEGITTYSEGEEPNRRVVIAPKE